MKNSLPFRALVFLLLFWGCQPGGQSESNQDAGHESNDEPIAVLFSEHPDNLRDIVPNIKKYLSSINKSLISSQPILRLEEKNIKYADLAFAQDVLLQNRQFVSYGFHPELNQPVHTAIMDIRLATPSELTQEKIRQQAIRVEMYNFFNNSVVLGFVDKESREVLKISHYPGMQPTIPPSLENLATQIALQYPQVQTALQLGKDNNPTDWKVDFRPSKGERSRHLVRAVSFTKNEKSLWVLVDLTDLKAIGYQWMPKWDEKRPKVVTERSLQNTVVGALCDSLTNFSQGKWAMSYRLTNSDGFEITDVTYQGKPILHSAKIVDWHISYSFKKGFGYSDAIGCPVFSSAAVVAFSLPEVTPIIENNRQVGFALSLDFRSPVWPVACNYRYENKFLFYDDGRFRILGVNHGLGCGVTGWYRPVFRLDMAAGNIKEWAEWKDNKWVAWDKEHWSLQQNSTQYAEGKYQFKMVFDDGSGYYFEPNNGQFADDSRGDNAYTYLTVRKLGAGEGELDMKTIGPCCNTDFQQGPEKFITPAEPISDTEIVIWYVPQMKNDNRKGMEYCWVETLIVDGHPVEKTYPGIVGPMFVPIKK